MAATHSATPRTMPMQLRTSPAVACHGAARPARRQAARVVWPRTTPTTPRMRARIGMRKAITARMPRTNEAVARPFLRPSATGEAWRAGGEALVLVTTGAPGGGGVGG